jgi:hypothetical protein
MAGASVPVDCGVTMPFDLAPRATLTCTYAASLLDTATRVNVATVQTTGAVGGGQGEAMVDFASATITAIDDCVDVDDSMHGVLGQVCAGDGAVALMYTHLVGPFEVCGSYVVDNTATFTTNTSGMTGSDSASVNVEVPCLMGCTLPGSPLDLGSFCSICALWEYLCLWAPCRRERSPESALNPLSNGAQHVSASSPVRTRIPRGRV